MPLLPFIGRSNRKVRAITAGIYVLLVLGAITMIYPFLITLNGAISNDWDYMRHSMFPRYLFSGPEQYMKFLAEKYLHRDFAMFQTVYAAPRQWSTLEIIRYDSARLEKLRLARVTPAQMEQLKRIHEDYAEWLEGYEPRNLLPLFDRYASMQFQQFLRKRYEEKYRSAHPNATDGEVTAGAIKLLDDTWGEGRYTSFDYIQNTLEVNYPYGGIQWMPPLESPRYQDYLDFLRQLPADCKVPITSQYLWTSFLEQVVGRFDEFRKEIGQEVESLAQVQFPSALPENPRLRELYQEFIDTHWPIRLVRLPEQLEGRYREYLRGRFADVAVCNKLLGTRYATWEEVPFHRTYPALPLERSLWRDFVMNQTRPEERERLIPEESFRAFLKARYQTLDALNAAYGWKIPSWNNAPIPLAEVDAWQFHAHSSHWLWEFLTFNFRRVFTFMAVQGRALLNTVVFVSLTLLATLTINPMAAYALSRFRMKANHKILLFCLATMAFPPSVIMIPSFLLLRDLGFLNTFAALVLPGLANGFSIFLLKGFFDSLPQELYEAASLDGASEWTVFWRITLPLCKPVLAYLSLMAFITAYGGFMWAFLTCQDPKMWTLMVWVYQFQQLYAEYPYMSMAAFVLASMPTLLVFLLCQKIILRGIVIPTMK